MIFLDSSNVREVQRFRQYGIIDGVTSNPSIMAKDGVTDIEKAIKDLVKVVSPLHLSVEVTTNKEEEMLDQATRFSKLSKSVVIKIPIHGPNGELDNLRVINRLYMRSINVNATCCMSATQCLIAAKAGAKFVSIFGGRVSDSGYDIIKEIGLIKSLLKCEWLKEVPKIIVGSVREPHNVIDWLQAGADIVTVPPAILEKMIVHSGTKEVVQMFLRDAKEITNGK